MKFLACLVSVLTVGGAAAVLKNHADPNVGHKLPTLATSPAVPAPGAVAIVADAVGAYLRGGESGNVRVKILDIVLGMRASGELGIALFKGIEDSPTGEHYYEYSRLEQYDSVVLAGDELKNFYLRDDVTNEKYFIEAATLEVRKDGLLGFRLLKGKNTAGVAFSLNTQGGCCGPVVHTKCIKELSDPCSISCPGPANCSCGGTGSCELVMSTRCEGECDTSCGGGADWHCVGPVSNCHCQAP